MSIAVERPYSFSGNDEPVGCVVFGQCERVDPLVGLPVRETPPQVTLDRRRRLIAVFGRLGQQLHDDGRDDIRDIWPPLGRGHRSPRDVGVHARHRIRRRERETAGQQFVDHDAERVEIAARVNRPVHPARLLRRHVRERSSDELRRLRRTALPRQARRDAEAPQPHPARSPIRHHVGRFDVLVNEAAAVQLAQRGRHTRPHAKDAGHVHRPARALKDQLATGILEDQGRSALERRQRNGPQRPRRIQVAPQRVFVLQHSNGLRSRMFGPRDHDEHRSRVGWVALAVQDELTVVENRLKALRVEIRRGGFHVAFQPHIRSARRRHRRRSTSRALDRPRSTSGASRR